MKESNKFMYDVAKKMSSLIKTNKIMAVSIPPQKIIGNWVY